MADPTPPTSQNIKPHLKAHIGTSTSFWLHSTHTGFDLTRPSATSPTTPSPRLTLQTTTSPITVSPPTTALIVIDMQNFFLSPVLGRSPNGPGHRACGMLVEKAVPAARRAGIRVVWVNWGLSEEEVRDLPPGVRRAFGFWSVLADDDGDGKAAVAGGVVEGEVEGSVAVDKHGNVKEKGIYKGIGSSMGDVELEGGEKVDAGRLLMRGSWNADLYPPLRALYDEGRRLQKNPDVWVHKNRMSALWGANTALQDFLKKEGITTLLFAGVNTDQCVGGSLTDAFSKGYDCVLLSDGCGTSSPGFAQECWEYNAANTFGFCTSCGELAEGVERMGK